MKKNEEKRTLQNLAAAVRAALDIEPDYCDTDEEEDFFAEVHNMNEALEDYGVSCDSEKNTDTLYIVICYAVHESRVASVDPFKSEEDAIKFIAEDATNTYKEEINELDEADREAVELEIDGSTARVIHGDGEFTWTWEIVETKMENI